MSMKVVLIALTVIAAVFIGTSHGMAALLGKRIRLRAYYNDDLYVKHIDAHFIRFRPNQDDGQYKLEVSFDVVPGISGYGISFRSIDYPTHFFQVCHSTVPKYSARLINYNDKKYKKYKKQASFFLRPPLSPHRFIPDLFSLESVAYPGRYIRGGFKDKRVRAFRKKGDHDSKYFSTWRHVVEEEFVVSGEWSLLYGNDNAVAGGTYGVSIEEGLTIGTSSSSTYSVENTWKVAMENEASGAIEGFGASVKTMFEQTYKVGVSHTRSSSWSKFTKVTKTYTVNLVKGEPLYLWQWVVHGITTDSTSITSNTDIYRQTTTNKPPPPMTGR